MSLKSFFTVIILALFIVSCKTQSSGIITSKQKAQEMGIYKMPNNKTASNKKKEETVASNDKKSKVKDTEEYDIIASKNSSYLGEQVINKAMQFQGVPYKTGGTTTSGMDCSGFVIASFADYNVKLPRTSAEMAKTGKEVEPYQAQKGDLIFFKTNGSSVINHVGIVAEVLNNGVKFIHSSTSKGVIISTTTEGYYKSAFAKINRVIE
jgi:murein DD-endopeptidase / murein LD-carboxypeptidase